MISLLTLTYNRPDLLKQLIASLEKECDIANLQLVLMDNGTDAETRTLAAKPWITYVPWDNSGNFSSMNNKLIEQAKHDNILFVNNDIEALTDFPSIIDKLLTENEKIGCVGAVLTYPDQKLQHAGVIMQEHACPANLGYQATKELRLNPGKVNPMSWNGRPYIFHAATGAVLGVRKKEFQALGGFHEEFDWAFEDVDFCIRMKALLGKVTVVEPSARAIHHESQSGGNRKIPKNLNLFQGRWKNFLRADYSRFR